MIFWWFWVVWWSFCKPGSSRCVLKRPGACFGARYYKAFNGGSNDFFDGCLFKVTFSTAGAPVKESQGVLFRVPWLSYTIFNLKQYHLQPCVALRGILVWSPCAEIGLKNPFLQLIWYRKSLRGPCAEAGLKNPPVQLRLFRSFGLEHPLCQLIWAQTSAFSAHFALRDLARPCTRINVSLIICLN